jgi:DNA-binding transcriptional LysR family regulator
MDTELAKTFLAIVSTGSFIRAADRLHVAQTTVSARIRILEQRLGRPLFVRNKAGASLTPAGEQFLRYAPAFLHLWERARQQVGVPPGHRSVLTLGGEVSLWHPLLLDWVIWMRGALPDVALRVHVDVPQDLLNQVAAGLVDAAVMYSPLHRPGLKVDLVMEEKLVLATSDPESSSDPSNLIAIDWGPDIAREYSASFPDATAPSLAANLGPFALDYALKAGGSGYFRLRVVQPLIASGKLRLVAGAPQFSYPIYVVYSSNANEPALKSAISGLHTVATATPDSDGRRIQ